jgi:predicted phosphodiesterase
MAKVPTGRELAAALCKRCPKATSLSLARKLRTENPDRFLTLNAANLAIRRERGAQGKFQRECCPPSAPKEHGAPGWKPQCPPSAAEPWLPVVIPGPCKLLSFSDQHIPYHSREAIEAAVKHGRKVKPDVVLLNGDIGDWYRLSRFQKNPKARIFKDELYSIREYLAWNRQQFPNARIIYKMGNHDEWWNQYVYNKAPELADCDFIELHEILKFADHGIERVDDNIIMAGDLNILHGHELGKGISSPVNPARGAWLRGNSTILVGHHHRTSSHPESDIHGKEIMTWSQGCLCNRTPQYARVNKWNWGFAYIEVAADNQFNVHNYRISNDYQVRTA